MSILGPMLPLGCNPDARRLLCPPPPPPPPAIPLPPLLLLDDKKQLKTNIARLAHPHPHTPLNGLVAPSRSLVTPPLFSLLFPLHIFPNYCLCRRRLPHSPRSYLRYANTCAAAVRQALKEPARAKVMCAR
jgi:hypothetical protein